MYATVQDCIERRGKDAIRLLEDVKGAEQPAYTGLEAALADASAEIDAYLGARHRLPLGPVPELVRRLCVEIGVYRRSEDAGILTDERSKRYGDAIRLLKDIAAGKASLGMADPDPPARAERPAVRVASSPRVLTRHATRGVL